MRTILYLNIVCTVIATELFLLVLKPVSSGEPMEHGSPSIPIVPARYDIPNITSFQQPTEVKIVGIELPMMKNTANAIPVLTYNPRSVRSGKTKEIPLIVQLEEPK